MKIIFTQFKSVTIADILPKTYVVYRESNNFLNEIHGAEYIEFEMFKRKYSILDASCFVFVGLNRIMTSSNRCDFIFEYLFTTTPNIIKYSIDTSPFIGEPWRLWFHYGLTGCGKFNIPYSYAIETDWQHWFYRENETSLLQPENLKNMIADTESNLDELKSQFEFYPVNELEKDFYARVKEHIFNKYNSPKLWINNILKECNKHFGNTYDFDSYLNNSLCLIPDLPVYRFVAEENKRRKEIYNVFTKGMAVES